MAVRSCEYMEAPIDEFLMQGQLHTGGVLLQYSASKKVGSQNVPNIYIRHVSVQWGDYPDFKYYTWEPITNLPGSENMIAEFNNRWEEDYTITV